MKVISRSLVINVLALLIVAGALVGWITKSEKKIAYIDNVKLFNGFVLKKELEGQLKKVEMSRKEQLDSLRLSIEIMSRKINESKLSQNDMDALEMSKRQYYMKAEQFDEDNQVAADEYNTQIWKQLNEYVKEFGSEHDYDYLMGTSGEGNLMYAREAHDITEEVLNYVNEKYHGKK